MKSGAQVIAWLQDNGCGTTAEIAAGIGFGPKNLSRNLGRMRDDGLLQVSEQLSSSAVGGRRQNVWGLTRKALDELVQAAERGKPLQRRSKQVAKRPGPLNNTPAEVIVKDAISRRNALEMVWGSVGASA